MVLLRTAGAVTGFDEVGVSTLATGVGHLNHSGTVDIKLSRPKHYTILTSAVRPTTLLFICLLRLCFAWTTVTRGLGSHGGDRWG